MTKQCQIQLENTKKCFSSKKRRRNFNKEDDCETLPQKARRIIKINKKTNHKENGCTHPLLWNGMCTVCGHLIEETSPFSLDKKKQSNVYKLDWIFDGITATSIQSIKELFKSDYTSLLENKKLRLVLDLDETLVHTEKVPLSSFAKKKLCCKTNYSITVDCDTMSIDYASSYASGKESIQTSGINHFESFIQKNGIAELTNEIKTFILGQYKFFVFMRPCLVEFLRVMSSFFEIYIYTHGTVQYAKQVIKAVLENERDITIHGILGRFPQKKRQLKKLSKMLCKRATSIIVDDRTEV